MAHTRAPDKINKTPQEMQNLSFDTEYNVFVVALLGYDGQSVSRLLADNLQMFCDTDGTYDYFCFAPPGTAQATAKWLVFRMDDAGSRQYADGNANFDNAATDPAALSYSYT
jgi:hypothetical protein